MSEIVDIIPKITSPLAVICFIAYIVYLFKRSDDKKIEKILTSPSTAQQKEVVQNILKDDPEVQIDPITDPREARKIAERIIANKLARHNKNMNTFLIFSAIFAITFLLSVLIPKITGGTVPTETETEKTSQTWAQVEAAKNKYPYAALSVVQHIKIRDVILPDSSKKRMAEFRNHYTLSATKDIKATDPIFKEQYLTNNARVVAWPGSEQQEMESIADNLYWVKFDLKKDEVRTLTTGANYYYDIPLAHTLPWRL